MAARPEPPVTPEDRSGQPTPPKPRRKTVTRGGRRVETTAVDPKPETRGR